MKKRTNHYITERQLAMLKGLSERMGMTCSELIRRAIDEYLLKMYKHRKETADAKA